MNESQLVSLVLASFNCLTASELGLLMRTLYQVSCAFAVLTSTGRRDKAQFTSLVKCWQLNKRTTSFTLFAVIETGVVLSTRGTEPSCIHQRGNSFLVTPPQGDILVVKYSAAPVRLVTTCHSCRISAQEDATTTFHPVESPCNIHSYRPPPTASTGFSG